MCRHGIAGRAVWGPALWRSLFVGACGGEGRRSQLEALGDWKSVCHGRDLQRPLTVLSCASSPDQHRPDATSEHSRKAGLTKEPIGQSWLVGGR